MIAGAISSFLVFIRLGVVALEPISGGNTINLRKLQVTGHTCEVSSFSNKANVPILFRLCSTFLLPLHSQEFLTFYLRSELSVELDDHRFQRDSKSKF